MQTTLSTSEVSSIKEFCEKLARESGSIICHYFKPTTCAESKSDGSPVTVADRASEQRIRELIQERFPDHGIIGEEMGSINTSARFQWVIDPIDGTRSFICGGFDFGTCIAFLENSVPIVGAIHQPVSGELMIGDGEVTTLNNEQVSVEKSVRNVSDCILLTTDIEAVDKYQNAAGFNVLSRRVRYIRTWGNCFAYTLLARGYPCIVIDPIMMAWDIAALIPIVLGAGGAITDYHGGDPLKGTSIVAGPAAIHDDVIQLLNIR